MIRRLRSLLRCRRGTATIEFALVSLFLFGTIMVALDFTFYLQQKLKLGQAVEAGAMMAYGSAASLNTDTVKNYIQNYAGTKVAPRVTQIGCNGALSGACGDGKCSCITATGFTAAIDCAGTKSACSSSSKAIYGNYLKIKAEMTYTPVIVPNRYLAGSIIQTAVVRLP